MPGPKRRRDFDFRRCVSRSPPAKRCRAALYERFKERFGADIIDGIGSTEALHMFISNRPAAIRPGSSGLLVEGYEARLLDEGAPAPPGEIGNLWIAGDSVCASYWNQHEKTKDTIEGRWIRTGDEYTQDADGYFWYAGRATTCSRSAGCGSARSRSRTRWSRILRCSSAASSAGKTTTAW